MDYSPILIHDTKTFHLSTQSTAGTITNLIPNYKSQIQFNIPDMVLVDDTIEYIHFSVLNAIIPNSFYIINASNNQLVITANSIQTTYTFEQGNYSATSFMALFLSTLGTGWGITLDSIASIFTITNSVNSFIISNTSTIDYILGFSDTMTSTFGTTNSVTLERCCNFLPLPRVLMRCSELGGGQLVGANQGNDVLLAIPNSANLNGQIVYNHLGNSSVLVKKRDLSQFTVSFTDDNGNLLNFNGVSCYWTFQFEICRRSLEKPPEMKTLVKNVNAHTSALWGGMPDTNILVADSSEFANPISNEN